MKQATCLLVCASLIAGPAAPAAAAVAPEATAGAAATPPASPTAGELSDQGKERFKAKDYDTAVKLFEQAHELDPNPNYLFNIGRVYEEKGDIGKAVEYYQRFVKEPGVSIESRDLALQRLRVLKAILQETDAKQPEQQPTPPPADQRPVASPAADPGQDNPDPNKTMRLSGYGLIGIGGVAVIVGAIFGGLAVGKKSDLDDSMIVEERQSLAHTGKSYALISDVTLITGAAFVVTGLTLALVARKRARAARTALAPSLGRDHAGLVWSVRF